MKIIKHYYIGFLYRNIINKFLGKVLYKNNSGLIQNLVGSYLINKINCNADEILVNIDSTIDGHINSLNKNGYCVLRKECVTDAMNLDIIFEKSIVNYSIPKSLRLEFSSIKNPEFYKKYPGVESILSKRLLNFLKLFYKNKKIRIINTHIYRTYSNKNIADTDREIYGSTEYWHNDGSTVESLKVFVLLSDVDEKSGPMYLIDKEESKKIISDGFSKYKNGFAGSTLDCNPNLIKFTGSVGDVLVGNTNVCLHRASSPEDDKVRDMLVYYLTFTESDSDILDGTEEQYYGFRRLFAK
jgi:hypothetical protein